MAFNGSLKLKIGASVDSSVATTFTQIDKAGKACAANLRKEFDGIFKNMGKMPAVRQVSTGMAQESKAIAQQGKAAVQSLGAVADGAKAKFADLARELKGMPADLQLVAREAQRALAKIETEKARAELGLGPKAKPAKAPRPSRFWFAANGNLAIKKPHLETLDMDPVRGAHHFGMAGVSFLRNSAAGMIHGMGVETDFAGLEGKNIADESLAQKISNSGYMPGMTGPNGRVVDKGDLLHDARSVGIQTGTDRSEVLGGLQKFVGLTGDLKLGRDLLGDMAKLARATGSNLEDVAAASAEVSNHLGNIPHKGEAVNAVMRQIAGQGKLGAIEMKDMATQIAKIAATAGQYEGGAQKNIAVLGVLAQESKLGGGSTSSSQAATSVAALARDLVKSKTISKWKAANLDPFADKEHTVLKDPQKLIEMALTATHGNLEKMGQLIPNSASMRSVRNFSNIYNEAGGGDVGIKAVREEFARLEAAQLTSEEVTRAFNKSMETSEAKVVQFNNQMGEAAEQLSGVLLPALKDLAPEIVAATSSFVHWARHLTGTDDHDDQNQAQKLGSDRIKNKYGLKNTTTSEFDGSLTVFNADAIHLTEDEVKERKDLLARQQATLAEDKTKAAPVERNAVGMPTGAGRFAYELVGGAYLDWGLQKAGLQATQEDKDSKVKSDEGQLARAMGDQREATDELREIRRLVDKGVAVIAKTGNTPPPPPAPGGAMPAESP